MRPVIGAALLAGCAATAGAQAPGAPRIATREEFRACQATKTALDVRTTAFEARMARYNASAVQLQHDSDSFLVAKRNAGLRSQREVDAYNQTAASFNTRAKALNVELAAIQKQQGVLNDEVLENNARCGLMLVPLDVTDEAASEPKPAPAR